MDGYSFVELNEELLGKIRDQWKAKIEALPDEAIDILWPTYQRTVGWCEKYVDPNQESGDLWLHVVVDGDGCPVALVELTNAHRAKDPSIKFLNIDLEPSSIMNLQDSVDQESLGKVLNVIMFAITSAFAIAINQVRKFKIYGRDDEIVSVFDALIAKHMNDPEQPFNIYRQQRWLVIEAV
ncbi:MAG TPA: hypothetical protein ENK05_11725 [Gammaproteobacteria bacterium]|nr:hypothetical protein [Gammaproteobacteria bacterium]